MADPSGGIGDRLEDFATPIENLTLEVEELQRDLSLFDRQVKLATLGMLRFTRVMQLATLTTSRSSVSSSIGGGLGAPAQQNLNFAIAGLATAMAANTAATSAQAMAIAANTATLRTLSLFTGLAAGAAARGFMGGGGGGGGGSFVPRGPGGGTPQVPPGEITVVEEKKRRRTEAEITAGEMPDETQKRHDQNASRRMKDNLKRKAERQARADAWRASIPLEPQRPLVAKETGGFADNPGELPLQPSSTAQVPTTGTTSTPEELAKRIEQAQQEFEEKEKASLAVEEAEITKRKKGDPLRIKYSRKSEKGNRELNAQQAALRRKAHEQAMEQMKSAQQPSQTPQVPSTPPDLEREIAEKEAAFAQDEANREIVYREGKQKEHDQKVDELEKKLGRKPSGTELRALDEDWGTHMGRSQKAFEGGQSKRRKALDKEIMGMRLAALKPQAPQSPETAIDQESPQEIAQQIEQAQDQVDVTAEQVVQQFEGVKDEAEQVNEQVEAARKARKRKRKPPPQPSQTPQAAALPTISPEDQAASDAALQAELDKLDQEFQAEDKKAKASREANLLGRFKKEGSTEEQQAAIRKRSEAGSKKPDAERLARHEAKKATARMKAQSTLEEPIRAARQAAWQAQQDAKIESKWGKLSEDELQEVRGMRAYGDADEEEVNEFLAKNRKKDQDPGEVKKHLRQTLGWDKEAQSPTAQQPSVTPPVQAPADLPTVEEQEAEREKRLEQLKGLNFPEEQIEKMMEKFDKEAGPTRPRKPTYIARNAQGWMAEEREQEPHPPRPGSLVEGPTPEELADLQIPLREQVREGATSEQRKAYEEALREQTLNELAQEEDFLLPSPPTTTEGMAAQGVIFPLAPEDVPTGQGASTSAPGSRRRRGRGSVPIPGIPIASNQPPIPVPGLGSPGAPMGPPAPPGTLPPMGGTPSGGGGMSPDVNALVLALQANTAATIANTASMTVAGKIAVRGAAGPAAGTTRKDAFSLDSLTDVQQTLNTISSAAATASAAMIGFVALGDPSTFSTFTGSVKLFGAELGQMFAPTVKEAAFAIQDFTAWMGTWNESTRGTVATIGKWVLVVGVVGTAVRMLAWTIGGVLTPAVWIFNNAWKATGIGLIISGVVALGYAVYALGDAFEWWGGKAQEAGDKAKGATDIEIPQAAVPPEDKQRTLRQQILSLPADLQQRVTKAWESGSKDAVKEVMSELIRETEKAIAQQQEAMPVAVTKEKTRREQVAGIIAPEYERLQSEFKRLREAQFAAGESDPGRVSNLVSTNKFGQEFARIYQESIKQTEEKLKQQGILRDWVDDLMPLRSAAKFDDKDKQWGIGTQQIPKQVELLPHFGKWEMRIKELNKTMELLGSVSKAVGLSGTGHIEDIKSPMQSRYTDALSYRESVQLAVLNKVDTEITLAEQQLESLAKHGGLLQRLVDQNALLLDALKRMQPVIGH